jgi:zinc/manganese transport system permease protein
MKEFLNVMAWPFFACLVLVGIHVYLGLHILTRVVIFVDLSIAQLAALGTTIGYLSGFAFDSFETYLFSLGFTLLGAIAFSLTRFRRQTIPQEAIVGIIYVVASSFMILLLDKAPHGAEHTKALLVGQILWTTGRDVLETALIYGIVGIVFFIFHSRFQTISESPELAREKGWSILFWDFLFYSLFGFIVTHSVRIAGVLLVFSFLIVPGVFSSLFSPQWRTRLFIGWGMGTFVSMLGVSISYIFDLPTGATVVTTFGFVLFLSGIIYAIVNRKFS